MTNARRSTQDLRAYERNANPKPTVLSIMQGWLITALATQRNGTWGLPSGFLLELKRPQGEESKNPYFISLLGWERGNLGRIEQLPGGKAGRLTIRLFG